MKEGKVTGSGRNRTGNLLQNEDENSEEPEVEVPVTDESTSELSALSKARPLNSFKTASGEIIQDEGPLRFVGRSEDGKMLGLNGRVTDIHKPLVSAAKVAEKNLVIVDGYGGTVIRGDTMAAKRIQRMVYNQLGKDPTAEAMRLYQEKGVYNFYLEKNGSWNKFNLDTGAADTVFPRYMTEAKSLAPVEEFPATRVGGSSGARDPVAGNSRRAQWP